MTIESTAAVLPYLTPRQRACVVLAVREHMDIDQLAQLLGVSRKEAVRHMVEGFIMLGQAHARAILARKLRAP